MATAVRGAATAVRAEASAQLDRWPLWTPVAFGAGAAVYFALGAEPPGWAAGLAVLVASLAALAVGRASPAWPWRRTSAVLALLGAMGAAGFADGALATRLAACPRIPSGLGAVDVEGWVVDVASPSAGRPRVLIAPTRIGDLARGELPARIRLTMRSGDPPPPGAAVRTKAILDPPPGPASPGGYDFARDAWFDRIGGVGLALRPPEAFAAPAPAPGLRLEMALDAFRWRLAERLTAAIQATVGEGPGRGLAAAVATSHQNWLSPEEVDDLRASGLAHMVAIAGLHTAAVTGFVFLALRLLVAAWPWLALRVSGKKVAAAGGLLAACAYLAVSGAHPPARRAAITAGVAFLAILADRRAVSLRSLAVAALAILALQPVSVVEPGFQMSFCATAALVAMAEAWPRRSGGQLGLPWYLAWPQRARDGLAALLAVSLVAGAATAPFAIQYFNRMSSYGVFANLFADFVASAILMPAVAIAAVAETLGAPSALAAPALALAGWSGQAILAIAHVFATAPAASHAIASAPWPALPIAFVAIILACLWRGRLRWVALPFSAAVLVWPRPPPPSAWIAPEGANAAVTIGGRAVVLKPGVQGFAANAWASHRGLIAPFDPQTEADLAFDCDRSRCAPRYGVTPALGAWWSRKPPNTEALADLCRASDILILRAAVDAGPACRGVLVLGPQALAQGGSAEIYPRPAGGWRVQWASAERGVRPWSSTAGAIPPPSAPSTSRRPLSP